ncbi:MULTISPECIES: universal stress protein [Alteromonadaceae]|uniref:universal stress protein n=1 Tax=Alteromonadaceae TaxID=72275 RepID=UPI001C0999DE|nr:MULTISPECIES: universal stress protein [Aliiglaciecola]MBU2876333.1 universal stress protein [Aliiglaciecola lipolytica]MDO6710549.1 universal stress protein [Aliiglaciecola sp. 2_MG-2023]MDO6751586.1 universal stress protein [Aliiglaciecola sp. 1_MG-2023]
MKRFKNFLYVMSNHMNEPSPALMRTVSLAKNNQADLTLLYVLPKLSLPKSTGIDKHKLEENILNSELENLQQLIASLDNEVNAKAQVRVGKRYLESIRAVLSQKYDLVVKEADKVSWLDRLIGSDDMQLLRNCPCPVWLMKKDEQAEYKHVMAAVDFDSEDDETCNDELNDMIIELAGSISLSEFATLHVVNAYDVPDAGFISLWVEQPEKVERELYESEYRNRKFRMDSIFDELKQKIGEEAFNFLSLRSHISKGNPGQELPKIADSIKADLVVMGTVARTGIAGLVIGNTAETILYQLQSSVLAIKPKGFVSPVS